MYYIFSFRSRTGALKFSESLKKEAVFCEVISTPQSISGGCGLSVKTNDVSLGRRVLAMGKFSGFTGIYRIKDYNGTLNITKI